MVCKTFVKTLQTGLHKPSNVLGRPFKDFLMDVERPFERPFKEVQKVSKHAS